jgi:hypothetical protein
MPSVSSTKGDARMRLSILLCLLGVSWWGVAQGSAQEAPAAKRIAAITGFPDWATSVAISPDGKLLAAGSYDVVKLWSLDDRTPVTDLATKCGFAHTLAFTPDSQRLLVGGYQQVQIWNVAAAKNEQTLRGHRGYVRDLAIAPDGLHFATASDDTTVRVWDTAGWKEVWTLGPLEQPTLGVAWSPDGTRLATVEGDETRLTRPGLVKLWNAASGELVRTYPQHERAATDVVFSADGSKLLTTSYDEHVNVYDVEAGTALGFFGGHSRPTNAVVLAAGGKVAISASGGRFKGKNEIKVFNPADGEEFGTIDEHEGKVTSLALAPDGHTLASASYDKTVAVWDLAPILAAVKTPETQLVAAQAPAAEEKPQQEQTTMRIGMIGLDTSHCIAFTKLLNVEEQKVEVFRGMRVVAVYPKGSPDIESSTSRVPDYTVQITKLGVEVVPTIDDLLTKVDAVFLETNDGRPHLEQVLPVLKAGKPVFVDKPIAASLVDGIAILEAARHYKVPCFSASSLRWMGEVQDVRAGKYGKVLGCDAYSPCSLEATHPDLFWYGIHGVEPLFTAMGTGCKTVTRASTTDFDQVTGIWQDGRIGTFRGMRTGKRGNGGTAFTDKQNVVLGPAAGYQPLVEAAARMFRTGEVPVDPAETIEIYAFMEAADESKRQGGAPVDMQALLAAARAEAQKKLSGLIPDYKP